MRLLSKHLNSMIGGEQFEKERRDISGLSGYYPNLLYDKNKDEFYRVVRIPYDENVLRRYRQGVSSKLPPFAFSFMKLDRNFNVLSEWTDQERALQPERGVFVDERGLWVLERKIKDEDKMTFKLIIFD